MHIDHDDGITTPTRPHWELGIAGLIGVAVGVGAVLASIVSMFGILVGIELALGSGGAEVALPTRWGEAFMLAGSGVVIAVATVAGSGFIHLLRRTSGWLARIAILVVGLALLVVGGRFVQLKVLEFTYGSMAAWYAANDEIDNLVAELEAGVSQEVLQQAIGRGFQYDNARVVGVMLDHGATPMSAYREDHCLLTEAAPDVVAAAAARGWSTDCTRR